MSSEGFTGDSWLDFVIDNHKHIDGLLTLWKNAEAHLPDHVGAAVVDQIQELKGTYFDENGLHCEDLEEEDGLWWCDEGLYSNKDKRGIYWQFKSAVVTWPSLLGKPKEEPPHIELRVDCTNSELGAVREFVQQHKRALTKKKQIRAVDDAEDRKRLLIYDIAEIVTLDNLQSPKTFRQKVVEAVRTFTEVTRPVLAQKKKWP